MALEIETHLSYRYQLLEQEVQQNGEGRGRASPEDPRSPDGDGEEEVEETDIWRHFCAKISQEDPIPKPTRGCHTEVGENVFGGTQTSSKVWRVEV